MSFDPATTGEAPARWLRAQAKAQDQSGEWADRRRLGIAAAELDGLQWLPDDVDGLAAAVAAADRPFDGALVPLVIHEPAHAERAFDAADWAADLINSAGGKDLIVLPHAEEGHDADELALSARQWNHAAAMMERLEAACLRHRVHVVIDDTVQGRTVRTGEGRDPDSQPSFALDTGSFVADGFVAVRFVSPEGAETTGGGGLWGLLSNRG